MQFLIVCFARIFWTAQIFCKQLPPLEFLTIKINFSNSCFLKMMETHTHQYWSIFFCFSTLMHLIHDKVYVDRSASNIRAVIRLSALYSISLISNYIFSSNPAWKLSQNFAFFIRDVMLTVLLRKANIMYHGTALHLMRINRALTWN